MKWPIERIDLIDCLVASAREVRFGVTELLGVALNVWCRLDAFVRPKVPYVMIRTRTRRTRS